MDQDLSVAGGRYQPIADHSRFGNEFEGAMHELIHEADTLSKLLAEQEDAEAARKSFRYVKVFSGRSI